MSVHPHTARALAEELALKTFPVTEAANPFLKEFEEYWSGERNKLAAEIEKAIVKYACWATNVAAFKDPTEIAGLIWYRPDGWGHGGLAMTWQERAEELEKEVEELNGRLEKIHRLSREE